MTDAISSDDVANDWKEALEDLREPSEASIFNLVTIARENLDHAQAIARTTIQHIKNVKSSQAKLNTFYVVDAIVKRIRSPYTMYFGHNLYSLFMGAYTTMDNRHRLMMDKLFETWIVPVPGSWTQDPVFEPQYTGPIQQALVKWRGVLQKQQQESRPAQRLPARPNQPGYAQQQQQGYRATPPPQQNRYPSPSAGRTASPRIPNNNSQAFPSQSSTPQTAAYPYQPPASAPPYPASYQAGTPQWPYPQPPQATQPVGQEELKRLIDSTMRNAANEYMRQSLPQTGTLISTLHGLLGVLSAQQLPPEQVQNIHREVSRIGADFMPKEAAYIPPQQQLPPTIRSPIPAFAQPAPYANLAPPIAQPVPTPAPENSSNQSSAPALSAAQLIALLGGGSANTSANNTPPVHVAAPIMTPTPQPPVPAPSASAAPQVGALDLFAQLQAAGLLGSSGPPPPMPPPTAQYASTTASNDVDFSNPASLRQPRPHLISLLYSAKPDQCRQCGRRFAATPEGKEAKGRHMDWHFKVNSRVADSRDNTAAAKVVMNRSWYIDEREWIAYREDQDGLPLPTTAAGGLMRGGVNGSGVNNTVGTSSSGTAGGPASFDDMTVPVPTSPQAASEPCPICMDSFNQRWERSTDQPVWTDAIKVGEKIYHASCFSEVSKGQQAMGRGREGSARGTPDPIGGGVLGKRKVRT